MPSKARNKAKRERKKKLTTSCACGQPGRRLCHDVYGASIVVNLGIVSAMVLMVLLMLVDKVGVH
jgi:hypothetical protein